MSEESPDAGLYDALSRLLPAQFEEVLVRCGVAPRSLPAREAAPALRVGDLVRMAANVTGLRECLWEALAKVQPERAASTLAEWQADCERRLRLVRVPGADRDLEFEADDLRVPLQLQLHRTPVGDRAAPHPRGAETVTGDFRKALRTVQKRRLGVGLAVIGDPGSGKTTLLQQIFCETLERGSDKLGLPAALTPVFVRCKTFERVPRKAWTLPAAIHAQAAADGYPGAPAALFADKRALLLLLDGLDEVAEEALRAELCLWLSEEALRYRDHWRFVVTSRIATWQRESRLSEHFLTADVLALDAGTVRVYVDKWCRAEYRGQTLGEPRTRLDAAAKQAATALLDQLFDGERAKDAHRGFLLPNPLSLALLCQVHTRRAALPRRRADLYRDCLHVLLERRPKSQGRPLLPTEAARGVLKPLAWAMQHEGSDDLPVAQVAEYVAKPLRRMLDLRGLTPEEFVRIAHEHCGIFRSRDYGSLTFFHAALREYLAAAHAVEARLFDELAALAAEQRWSNVVLLATALEGGFSGLAAAMLRTRTLALHIDLLLDGLSDAMSIELEPFIGALEGARPSVPPEQRTTASDVVAILRLLGGRDEPDLLDSARHLLGHPNPAVAQAVRSTLDLQRASASGAAVAGPTAGNLWREPVTGLTFVWIPPGEFLMGFAPGRRVELTQGFWMAQHPVTNEVYGRFLAAAQHRAPQYWRNSRFNRPQQPVVGVDFNDALAFCAWASKAAALDGGRVVDLPTEAQWEYTARAAGGDGRPRTYPWGDEEPTLERAVFRSNATAPVGGRPAGATPLGVHDMAGNVYEWCLDAWRDELPGGTDPIVEAPPGSAAPRVVRGGSWRDYPGDLRAAGRFRLDPGDRDDLLGFRVVCRGSRQHVGH